MEIIYFPDSKYTNSYKHLMMGKQTHIYDNVDNLSHCLRKTYKSLNGTLSVE